MWKLLALSRFPLQRRSMGPILSRKFTKSETLKFPLQCWSCKNFEERLNLFCSSCKIIQPPDKGKNFFRLFGIEPKFDIDVEQVRKTYIDLQKQLHPDSFHQKSEIEKAFSARHSASLSHAYNVLRRPHLRAKYLLTLSGRNMENAIIEDEDFLSSVMNTMEKIENTSDEAVIKEIREVNSKEIERLMKVLSKSFKEGDLEAAFDATLRLQYLMRIQDISESKIGIS